MDRCDFGWEVGGKVNGYGMNDGYVDPISNGHDPHDFNNSPDPVAVGRSLLLLEARSAGGAVASTPGGNGLERTV